MRGRALRKVEESIVSVNIIVDSCCDLTEEMRADVLVAPLKIIVDDMYEYVDDANIDIADLLFRMAQTTKPSRSACPSPGEYAQLMAQADVSYVITLSSKLSGSYNAAMLGREIALEKDPTKRIYVFDTHTATAGEVLHLLHLQKLIAQGKSEEEIVRGMEKKRESTHTVFVLEDLSNLMKNGRLSKVAGTIATMLSIRPLLAEDGEGEIKMLAMARGMQKALKNLVHKVAQLTVDKPAKSIEMVLSFCNCPERAQELRDSLFTACASIRDIKLIHTSGLSTMYAADGGVVVAF